ncbi:MAG: phosphoribosylpyrophosphate synthetase [Cyclobacteriaceae bacterium]|nr:phosphoribosylpyrophosphate synthetase [Cyclobacteriaceae bacterium]
MQPFETLTEAIQVLKNKGYDQDFNLHPEWIECPPLKLKFKPEEFHVDEVHRFEGMTNPDDSSVLYAISSTSGVKGIVVDAYGAYAESISPLMIEKLKIDRNTEY